MCLSKKFTQKTIGWFSLIVCLAGIVMIVMGVIMFGSDTVKQIAKEEETVDDFRKATFYALVIFALATIGIAACGVVICSCRISNRCCVIGYGIFLLPMWIILIVVGAIGLYASTASKDELTTQCNDIVDKVGTAYTIENNYNNIEISLDVYETLLMDEYMCSTDCPCVDVDAATKATWTTEALADGGRAGKPLVFVPAGTSGSFETYQSCIQSFDATNLSTAGYSNFGVWANQLNNQDNFDEIMDWVTFFEDEYNCAGVCEPALFYWSKSVSQGMPTESCISSIKDDLSTAFMGLGGACLISGFVLLCNFVLQYCLWVKKD